MATEAGIELQKVTAREVSKTLDLTTKIPCALTLHDTFMDLIDPKQLYRVVDAQIPNLNPIFLSAAKKEPKAVVRLGLLKDVTSQRYDLRGIVDLTCSYVDILHQSMPDMLKISQHATTDEMREIIHDYICHTSWIRIIGIDAVNEAKEAHNIIYTRNPERNPELRLFAVAGLKNEHDSNDVTRWWIKSVQPTLLAKSEKYLPL